MAAIAAAICLLSAAAVGQGQRIPRQDAARFGSIVGRVSAEGASPIAGIAGVSVTVTGADGKSRTEKTNSEGLFRFAQLAPGEYTLRFEHEGIQSASKGSVIVRAGELLGIEIHVQRKPEPTSTDHQVPGAANERVAPEALNEGYREIIRRPETAEEQSAENLPRDSQIMSARTDRWNLPLPLSERYDREGEFPNQPGRWYNPFAQNILKGDKPIFGQHTFFSFTGTGITGFDLRRLPVPSGVSAVQPGESEFFGRGRQVFLAQTFRFALDLFHGDTSFKPVDWRIRVTPAVQINQLWTRERGVVNFSVLKGTDRTDAHASLQEAFFEAKLADLGPNYDFVSVRAGIQQFNSDFRGLLFVQEQPGVRIFGNLKSNRFEYNAAYFHFLEKDTNSGLNSFNRRHQQVLLANLYVQDFVKKGYTAQVSYHFNKDDATTHYDENRFLVRPAPIGVVRPHDIRAHYIGWTGSGHFGRWNVSHAFYQALGFDSFNGPAGRRVDINAQMAAMEVSVDKDWLRLRGSALFASGDKNPQDRIARGFDAISEGQAFAGGIFSFFNREGIRLTGTLVPLTSPESFLPNFRSSKEEGQANFVNPGIMILNAGADIEVTTKMRAVINGNLLRFHHTKPLELLLNQSKIESAVGADYGVGIIYRPPLSENIVITGGVSALTPFTGLRQIYTSKTLVSVFAVARFQF